MRHASVADYPVKWGKTV